MTMISINNQEIKDSQSKELLLSELAVIMIENANQDERLTSIELDGEEFDFDINDQESLQHSILNFKKVNFKFKTSIQLAHEALNSSAGYIEYIETKVLALVELYNKGKVKEAEQHFTEVIEVMDLFIQLMANIHNAYKQQYKDDYKKAEVIQNLEIHLLSILKALVPAKEKNDIIMLCDLLEYELVDNLTQWKIKALPELRTFQSN